MHFGPDDYSSDEDGLSDDNDYYDFKVFLLFFSTNKKNVQIFRQE